MTRIIKPTVIPAVGNKPKTIEEFFGQVNTGNGQLSIARMTSPEGWVEPGQTPEFDEYTLVLKGSLRVSFKDHECNVRAGEAIQVPGQTWVQYSTPEPGGAEYIAVCLPAFDPKTVHRDV